VVIPFYGWSNRYRKRRYYFMKNELQICGTFKLEFKLIHANLRGMYRMYKSIWSFTKKTVNFWLKPVKYLIFNFKYLFLLALQRILIEPILNTFTQSHGTASKKNKINTHIMRKTFFIVLSIVFLLPINIFSKNGDNKAFVDPELTVEIRKNYYFK
jgi:hypothetical protein